jgi:hypothetical protein
MQHFLYSAAMEVYGSSIRLLLIAYSLKHHEANQSDDTLKAGDDQPSY